MGFLAEINYSKNILYETQQRTLLSSEELLTISSLNSRLRIIAYNCMAFGLFSSIFIRILMKRYRIKGFKPIIHDLVMPFALMDYYIMFEYPLYRKGYLKKLGVFVEDRNLNEEMEDRIKYEKERKKHNSAFKRNFYTNSQYWH